MLDPKMKASEMDLRSYFAAMAISGCVRSAFFGGDDPELFAERATVVADALIAALNEKK